MVSGLRYMLGIVTQSEESDNFVSLNFQLSSLIFILMVCLLQHQVTYSLPKHISGLKHFDINTASTLFEFAKLNP